MIRYLLACAWWEVRWELWSWRYTWSLARVLHLDRASRDVVHAKWLDAAPKKPKREDY